MRVALVRPSATPADYDPEIQEPLGIEYLAAFLRLRDHEVVLVDMMSSGMSVQETADRIAHFAPDVVGLSIMSDASLDAARALQSSLTQAMPMPPRYVAGGCLPTTQPNAVAAALAACTELVRYEGELPLARFIESLGPPNAQQPALPNAQMADLDDLPWPARDLADAILERCGMLSVQGSRGCVGACSFCCAPMGRTHGVASWRGRTPSSIADELAALNQEHGAIAFSFVDDDFLGPPSQAEHRAHHLAEAIRGKGIRIGFGAQFRAESLSEAAVHALSEAGLAYAFVGVESNDPRTLRAWHRPTDIDRVWQNVELLQRAQVETSVGAILFHPGSTLRQVEEFATRLRNMGHLNYRTATSRLHLLPGSELYRNAPPPSTVGPWTPPIEDESAATLHSELTRSLAPLRPAWVHAACLAPTLCSKAKSGSNVSSELGVIRTVLSDLDQWVDHVLRHLIGGGADDGLRAKSRALASVACGQMYVAGLVPNIGQLRAAIMHGGP